jgi:hypothetical protein
MRKTDDDDDEDAEEDEEEAAEDVDTPRLLLLLLELLLGLDEFVTLLAPSVEPPVVVMRSPFTADSCDLSFLNAPLS